MDFEAGAGGDVLDIADLLFDWTSYAGGSGGPLSDFVRLEPSGPFGSLEIDADGNANAASWQTLASIVDGSTLDLTTLLNNGNLDILI
jgi:hypothetical protein